ncbi:plasmid replication protein RepC [Rhizobiaceae bacterium BDR2-2]|uniref:Plasmid replication protein RepC n=1 Tax=Ectorhizobium quercum TaxID=2965071 RepID=A0AAE3SVL8_9HYPH|nr:plasmid replication protein RepC [Ectorhizobium quercum]MCX8998257.1 plasmid replication protein RepC [Ectorhizobium quercum]
MTERLATTPFGGGRMRADIFALQQRTARRQDEIAAGRGGNDTGQADKWELLRALIDARAHYGLSDRALTVLDALLTFHPERILDGSQPIVVFPSNRELSLRSRGMSDATLRRHLAALVGAGLLLRRDSPNGKRYCRRDEDGLREEAFGFDLAPLALAAAEIHAKAEAVRAEARDVRILRGEITLHLRDIAKTVEAALDERRAGDWADYALRLQGLSGRLSRAADSTGLVERRDALVRLRAEVENAYLDSLSEQEMSGYDDENERHIHTSNTEPPLEIKGYDPNTAAGAIPTAEKPESGSSGKRRHSDRKAEKITLTSLLRACPTIRDYSRDGIATWKDARATADLVRSMLGISPSAWREAIEILGEPAAITVIAAILERAGDIHSPGGYLRDLTRKAQQGKFSIHPMLKALRSAED